MYFGYLVNLFVSDLGYVLFKPNVLKYDFAVFLTMRTPRFPPFHRASAESLFNGARALDCRRRHFNGF